MITFKSSDDTQYDVIERYPSKYELYKKIRFYLIQYKYKGELTTQQYRTLLGHAKRFDDRGQNYLSIEHWFLKRSHYKAWADILKYRYTKRKYLIAKTKVTFSQPVEMATIDIDVK